MDRDEVRELNRLFGNEIGDEELDMAMLQMDRDGGGDVDFDEFYQWWRDGGPQQAAAWATKDEDSKVNEGYGSGVANKKSGPRQKTKSAAHDDEAEIR